MSVGSADLTGFATGPATASSSSSGTSAPPAICRATVLRAPVSFADGLEVNLEGFGTAYDFEIPGGHWDRRGALPPVGAMCVVVFDDRGDVWVPVILSLEDPAGGGGDDSGNIDGGRPDSVYGGTDLIDGNGVIRS